MRAFLVLAYEIFNILVVKNFTSWFNVSYFTNVGFHLSIARMGIHEIHPEAGNPALKRAGYFQHLMLGQVRSSAQLTIPGLKA